MFNINRPLWGHNKIIKMNKKKKQRTIIDNIDRCAELLEACSRYNKDHVAKLYGILAMLSR